MSVAGIIVIHAVVLCMTSMACPAAYADDKPFTLPEAPLRIFPEHYEYAVDSTFLPRGDLFRPLIADPKEPQFYLSYRVFKFSSEQIHSAVGGYGGVFGLYRHVGDSNGYDWQVSFSGGIHAQFDLHSPSLDLVNTDYTFGFPVTLRNGPASYRLLLYHQSSHLGDEFLLHNHIQRVELSYEALQLIRSYERQTWRTYYGGEYIVHQGPTDLKPAAIQGGVEFTGSDTIVGRGTLVGGCDLKSDQQHDWSLDTSIKIGLQFASSDSNGRAIRVLAEGYKGFNSYGQFYIERIMYVGLGIYLILD